MAALLLTLGFAESAPKAFCQETPPPDAGLVVPLAGPGEGLEGAISGTSYALGPGDVLTVGVWGPENYTWQAMVDLEGTLLIPTVGPVLVNMLPLNEAKAAIRKRILSEYRNVEITISLTRLRRFQVHVLGQVRRPGTYLATAVDRVSSAVSWAGGLNQDASSRRLLVMNQSKLRVQADLQMFLERGELDQNPLLSDGDVVYVPFAGKTFSVIGAVNAPGSYHFQSGDRLSTAIELAGGVAPNALVDTLEVARYQPGENTPFRFFVLADGTMFTEDQSKLHLLPQAAATFNPTEAELEFPHPVMYADFELQEEDMVFVRHVPIERQRRLVDIQGEVEHPGRYAISEDVTTLKDAVAMAGGLTPEAFLDEAKLIRQEAVRLEDREFERLKLIPPADMTESEYEYFKVRSRENPGQMVVRFKELLSEGQTSEDVVLRGGDKIEIPSRKDFVSVIGMVQYPGNVLYEPGLAIDDYIAHSGGYAEDADKGKSRLIRAAGGESVSLNDVDVVNQGDTIFIPEKGEGKFWSTFMDALTVTTQVLAIYIVIDAALSN